MTTVVTWVPGRAVTDDLFTGSTSSAILDMSWADGALTVLFEDDLTDTQVIECKLLMQARNSDEVTDLANMFTSRIANRAYIDLAAPTEAELYAQVLALTQQASTVMSLVMGDLADLEPTP
jgi:hypothetical protein